MPGILVEEENVDIKQLIDNEEELISSPEGTRLDTASRLDRLVPLSSQYLLLGNT